MRPRPDAVRPRSKQRRESEAEAEADRMIWPRGHNKDIS